MGEIKSFFDEISWLKGTCRKQKCGHRLKPCLKENRFPEVSIYAEQCLSLLWLFCLGFLLGAQLAERPIVVTAHIVEQKSVFISFH